MKNLKSIEEFLQEAISLKMYKENLPKKLWYNKSDGYKSWDNIFGKNINRITIPLQKVDVVLPKYINMMGDINRYLEGKGYRINNVEDYLNNKVYKIGDTKNPLKIGSLLKKYMDNKIDGGKYHFESYDVDVDRKYWKEILNNASLDLKIIISRHPYDLLGMSSGRSWRSSSCMTLGSVNDKVYMDIINYKYEEVEGRYIEAEGKHKDKITQDILEGTLVAYVVKSDDNNINNPISRLLIKPYVNEKKVRWKENVIWGSADKYYGQKVVGFKESVDEWIASWQGDVSMGLYCIKKNLYDDGKGQIEVIKPSSKWNDNDKEYFLSKVCKGKRDWEKLPTGEWVVNVKGSVDMEDMDLTEIPIKFGKVSGHFDCHGNKLTTLKNCPISVGGDFFDCSHNKLTSLEFAPTKAKHFDCSWNEIPSLEFSPIKVNIFKCGHNKLTSLNGLNMKSLYELNCNGNQLTSLEGCPTKIEGSLFCSGNELTSLNYSPKYVGINFEVNGNQLTSLEGFPSFVGFRVDIKNQKNGHQFTEEEIRSIIDVKYVDN